MLDVLDAFDRVVYAGGSLMGSGDAEQDRLIASCSMGS
jgi:hypothetical protein